MVLMRREPYHMVGITLPEVVDLIQIQFVILGWIDCDAVIDRKNVMAKRWEFKGRWHTYLYRLDPLYAVPGWMQ